MVKNLTAMLETQDRSLDWEDALEKEIATHSSILAWEIPWTEEPKGPWGCKRVGYDLVTRQQKVQYDNVFLLQKYKAFRCFISKLSVASRSVSWASPTFIFPWGSVYEVLFCGYIFKSSPCILLTHPFPAVWLPRHMTQSIFYSFPCIFNTTTSMTDIIW